MPKIYNAVRKYFETISDQPPIFNKMDGHVSVRFWIGGDGYTCRVEVDDDKRELVLTYVGDETGLPQAKHRALSSLFKRANKEVQQGKFTFNRDLGMYFFKTKTVCGENTETDIETAIVSSLRIFAAAREWVLDVVRNNERPADVMDEWCKEIKAAETETKEATGPEPVA